MANSLITIFNGGWAFIVGLGATQVIDAIAQAIVEDSPDATGLAQILALSLDLVLALVFVGFGWLANKGKGWAFVLGMALYLLDGSLFVLVEDWKSAAFHVFAFFCLGSGYMALRRTRTMHVSQEAMSKDQIPPLTTLADEKSSNEISG